MKKIVFFILVVFLVLGCSNNLSTEDEIHAHESNLSTFGVETGDTKVIQVSSLSSEELSFLKQRVLEITGEEFTADSITIMPQPAQSRWSDWTTSGSHCRHSSSSSCPHISYNGKCGGSMVRYKAIYVDNSSFTGYTYVYICSNNLYMRNCCSFKSQEWPSHGFN